MQTLIHIAYLRHVFSRVCLHSDKCPGCSVRRGVFRKQSTATLRLPEQTCRSNLQPVSSSISIKNNCRNATSKKAILFNSLSDVWRQFRPFFRRELNWFFFRRFRFVGLRHRFVRHCCHDMDLILLHICSFTVPNVYSNKTERNGFALIRGSPLCIPIVRPFVRFVVSQLMGWCGRLGIAYRTSTHS